MRNYNSYEQIGSRVSVSKLNKTKFMKF